MEPVGFIGLGLMGEPMARNLLGAGYALTIYNRTAEKARQLVGAGAKPAATPADAVQPGGVVITMVADDRALEEVTTGPQGFGERLGQGGIHLCMATVSPDLARRLAAWHEERGSRYVAAPVFGRPPAAAAAKLWIVSSGVSAAKQRVQPILKVLGQSTSDFGEDAGAANVVKICGNFLISCVIEGLAEVLTVGQKNDIERRAMADFFASTLFACPIYQNYGPMVAAGRFDQAGFLLRLGLKDNKLMLDAAENAAVPMPFGSVVHDRFVSAIGRGRGEWDWTAIALNASEEAGLDSTAKP
jgi:3-hydroxyisobutyrate dehydrogenase-like beta-hydroxyacid dehydrogenase